MKAHKISARPRESGDPALWPKNWMPAFAGMSGGWIRYSMRITDIRETSVALNSTLKNSSIDFSEMTTSVVAVITDVMRGGKPVVGYAFNSTGRYACGAQMRARFIPRLLKAEPKSLLDDTGNNLDPAKCVAAMMRNEKS